MTLKWNMNVVNFTFQNISKPFDIKTKHFPYPSFFCRERERGRGIVHHSWLYLPDTLCLMWTWCPTGTHIRVPSGKARHSNLESWVTWDTDSTQHVLYSIAVKTNNNDCKLNQNTQLLYGYQIFTLERLGEHHSLYCSMYNSNKT